MKKNIITVLVFFLAFFNSSYSQSGAKVCISYPRGKEDKTMNVFFNKTNIGRIHYGERLVFLFSSEGDLKVTISEGETYIEPKTLSKNTRTVMVKNGKKCYLEISKAELSFISDEKKGEERFNEASKFISKPSEPEIENLDEFIMH